MRFKSDYAHPVCREINISAFTRISYLDLNFMGIWLWWIVIDSTTICKLVDLILAFHQSDCGITNWVGTKTVHSSSTNHGQITARFWSFFRWPSGPRDQNKNVSLRNFRGLQIYKWVFSTSFVASPVHILVIFIQQHVITCKLLG